MHSFSRSVLTAIVFSVLLLLLTFVTPAQGEPGGVHQSASDGAAGEIQWCSECFSVGLPPAHQRLGSLLRIRCGGTAKTFCLSVASLCNLGPTCEIWKPVISDAQRFYPTSPLRDYTGTTGRRRRSHSACVRFKDARATEEDVRMQRPTLNQCHLLLSCIFRLLQEGTPSEEHAYEFFLHKLAALFGATFVQISFQKPVYLFILNNCSLQ